MSALKYRPEIDGLRACAVIPVILFHMGFSFLRGGFLGVDVFFVISGFLITSIILHDHTHGTFSFARFWQRRIRRIFPPLAVMLIATALAGYWLLFRTEQNTLGWQGITAVLSFANISLWHLTGNYWGANAENSLLLHTWSLSVEEQFYFVFPVLLYLLVKYARQMILVPMLLLTLGSFALYLYGSQHFPSSTFYLLPTRAWELSCGCLIAIHNWKKPATFAPPFSLALALLGLAAILSSYFIVSGDHAFLGYLTLPALGTAAVITFTQQNPRGAQKLLSLPLLVFIGKISYSLYLWHWPVLVMAKKLDYNIAAPTTRLFLLALIFSLALASYHFVEKTSRRAPHILRLASILFLISLSLSLLLLTTKNTYDTHLYNQVVWNGNLYNANPVSNWDQQAPERFSGVITPKRDLTQTQAYLTGGIIKTYGPPTPQLIVMGDSHALMWSGMIDDVARDLKLTVSFYGADGISPFVTLPLKPNPDTGFLSAQQRHLFDTKRLAYLQQWKPQAVIISVRWSLFSDVQVTEDLIQYIGQTGAHVILIAQPPELFFGDNNALQYLAYMKKYPQDKVRQYLPPLPGNPSFEKGKNLLHQLHKKYPFCHIIEVDDIYSNQGMAWVLDGANTLYIDDDHLSQYGASLLKDRFKTQLQQLIHNPPSPSHPS